MVNSEFEPALKQRSAYKFWIKEHVRFTDLDALGHVSAVRTHEYFNSARALLFNQAIANWPNAQQLPVLKSSVMLYEKEMRFPLDLDVGLAIEKWGTTSMTMVLGVFGPDCLALSRNVFVFIDADTRLPVAPTDHTKLKFFQLAEHMY